MAKRVCRIGSEDRERQEIGRHGEILLCVSPGLRRVPEPGEAKENRRGDRRGQDEVRPKQRQNPDRPGGEVGDAKLAHQRQGLVALDLENLFGGEPRASDS
jgi:hypothetical protein